MTTNKSTSKTNPRNAEHGRHRLSTVLAAAATLAVLLLSTAPLATSQQTATCSENGMNIQCTDFGTIKMESRRDIRGEPIDTSAQIYLNTGYANQGARWIMFSVRNSTDDGPSPVTVGLNKFSTENGDVVTTRVEQTKSSELNLWVDVLDLPVGIPITLDLKIGATDRGAYSLETLVLAFDRGYAPIQDGYGNDASLFSFTLLGVNKETASTVGDVDTLTDGKKLPAPGFIAVIAVLAAVGAFVIRRRTK